MTPIQTTNTPISEIVHHQNRYFNQGETRNPLFRKTQLQKLLTEITRQEPQILQALKTDLNKSAFESYAAEVALVREEIRFFIKNVTRLAKPRRVPTPLSHFRSTSRIHKEPYGTVLIMSPWNYPFQLTMVPLAGALAAGNTVILKPSNYAPATAGIIKQIIQNCFPEEYISVVEGGREANTELLNQKFDYIFFTGGITVGKLVMKAAAENLTPVSLELGGKSPCIVDSTAAVDLAAKRIVWGKFLNAGQTCVAPDYLLVEETIVLQLLNALKKTIREFFGDHPETNPDYPKIITEKHFSRLKDLAAASRVCYGGTPNEETRQIAPALIYPTREDDPVMQEEIFGPLLPILTYKEPSEALTFINSRPRPLALYLFTQSRTMEKKVLSQVSFGGGCINDTVMHIANPHLPFGGVGDSGMGGYHGTASYETFSHSKSILKKSNNFNFPQRYPPYTRGLDILKRVMG